MFPFFETAKKKQKRRDAFCSSRQKCSDQDFVVACGCKSSESQYAIQTRKAIARLAGIEPDFIWHNDRFNLELVSLPFWREPYSNLFIRALEKEGICISTAEAMRLENIDAVTDHFCVRELVQQIVKIKKSETQTNSDP